MLRILSGLPLQYPALARRGMVATLEAVWGEEEHVVFGAACYMHGLLTTSGWQTLQVTTHNKRAVKNQSVC